MSVCNPSHNSPPPLPPPGPNPTKNAKIYIPEDEDLHGCWGLFEVKDLNAFYALGFSPDKIEIQGHKVATGSHMVLVEELPHITLAELDSATQKGVIVQSKVER